MRRSGKWIAVARWLLGLSAFSAAAGAAPAPRVSFQALGSSRVRIAGRATLGAWECETKVVVAAIEPGPGLELLAAKISGRTTAGAECARHDGTPVRPAGMPVPHANISIPVASLECDKPGMRRDVLRALKSEEAPLIVFVLTAITDLQVQGRGRDNLGRYRVTARGDLVLAGELRNIEIAADVVQETPRRFRIDARKELRMSEFGIAPPTALFGLVRAEDVVTVAFNLVFQAVEH